MLKTLHHQIGKTFIYVTRDQIEAMTLADRNVSLNGGEFARLASPGRSCSSGRATASWRNFPVRPV